MFIETGVKLSAEDGNFIAEGIVVLLFFLFSGLFKALVVIELYELPI